MKIFGISVVTIVIVVAVWLVASKYPATGTKVLSTVGM